MIARAPNEEIIAVADIGGTNARFALARVRPGARPEIDDPVVLKTADYPDFVGAYKAFAATIGAEAPTRGSFAVASPIRGDVLKFTNSPWKLQISTLADELGLREVSLLNDFGAVAHAIAKVDKADLEHICGPERPFPQTGVISILGPGTGLGVAQLIRNGETYRVIETEGGHIDFAPRDEFEDHLLNRLRKKYGRVSIERVLSGSGLCEIADALGGSARPHHDDAALWAAAISEDDATARAALEKFCLCFGAVAGDAALIHGASAVVLAGGLAPRIAAQLTRFGFFERFVAKGRYRDLMADIPVWMIRHPQPGLFGAAAAFSSARSANSSSPNAR